MLGKRAADDILIFFFFFFFFFFEKIGFDIPCKLSLSVRENLHEMSIPSVWAILNIFMYFF